MACLIWGGGGESRSCVRTTHPTIVIDVGDEDLLDDIPIAIRPEYEV